MGILGGAVLLGFLFWGGCHLYNNWEERHLVRRAAAYLSGGGFKDAALSARRALQLNPASVSASRVMAEISERAGDPTAIYWRRKVFGLQPPSNDDALALATCALRFEDLSTAEKALTTIDNDGQNTAAFHTAAARLAQARKQPADAKDHWAKAIQLSPGDKSYQLQFALTCLELPTPQERESGRASLRTFRNDPNQRAVATRALILDGVANKENPETLQRLARDLQSYPEALFGDRLIYLDILRQLHDPAFTAYLTNIQKDATSRPDDLASLLSWMNRSSMSVLAIDYSHGIPAKSLTAWPVPIALAEAYARLNDWPGLEHFATNGNWTPFEFLRRAYLARALRGQGRTEAAERELTAAEKEASAQTQELVLLTRTISGWGWDSDTAELLWTLSKRPEEKVQAFHMLYHYYRKAGDTVGLYRVLLRLVEVDPADLNLRNNLAQISLLLNADVDRARHAAAELYAKEPLNAAYVSTYAFSLYEKGDTKSALQVMSRLHEDQFKDPSVAAYYGIMLASGGEKTKALEYLEIGKKAQLLPEEKILMERAEAASK